MPVSSGNWTSVRVIQCRGPWMDRSIQYHCIGVLIIGLCGCSGNLGRQRQRTGWYLKTKKEVSDISIPKAWSSYHLRVTSGQGQPLSCSTAASTLSQYASRGWCGRGCTGFALNQRQFHKWRRRSCWGRWSCWSRETCLWPGGSTLHSCCSSQCGPLWFLSAPPSNAELVECIALPPQRWAYSTKGIIIRPLEELLVEPHGHVFTQPFSQQLRIPVNNHQAGDPFATDSVSLQIHTIEESPNSSQVLAQQKKARQWAKWRDEIIPSMLQPYFSLLCKTQSLRYVIPADRVPSNVCSCCKQSVLTIICVHFCRMSCSLIFK